MISENAALRLLEAERERLRRSEPHTDYVAGILYGLKLATYIIHALWEQTKDRLIANPLYLSTIMGHFKNKKYIVHQTKKRARKYQRMMSQPSESREG